MQLHNWTVVHAEIFHSFHLAWVAQLGKTLNQVGLPKDYYALTEQHANQSVANVLELRNYSSALEKGSLAVAEAPDTGDFQAFEQQTLARRRSLAIRHVSNHQLIALIEIVSPGNKGRRGSVEEFTSKVADALHWGVHVLVVDLFPPGTFDPGGFHRAILKRLAPREVPCEPPALEPAMLASYVAGLEVQVFLEHVAIGSSLPEMPLFLRPDRYVNVPLAPTYDAAFDGMRAFWRDVLEGRGPE